VKAVLKKFTVPPHDNGIDEFECIWKEKDLAYSQVLFQYLPG
jgi:hypothetical protein